MVKNNARRISMAENQLFSVHFSVRTKNREGRTNLKIQLWQKSQRAMLSQDSVRVLTFSTDFTTTESTININFQLDTVKKCKPKL